MTSRQKLGSSAGRVVHGTKPWHRAWRPSALLHGCCCQVTAGCGHPLRRQSLGCPLMQGPGRWLVALKVCMAHKTPPEVQSDLHHVEMWHLEGGHWIHAVYQLSKLVFFKVKEGILIRQRTYRYQLSRNSLNSALSFLEEHKYFTSSVTLSNWLFA